MKKLNTTSLRPGMVTAEDVYSFNNQLILPKGLTLTDKTITKLEFYSILSIRIEDDAIEPEAAAPSPDISYSERIKASPEFQQFKAEFEADTAHFKDALNDVVERGAPLNVDTLMSQTASLISNAQDSSVNIFDMLHNLRDYDDSTYIHCMNVALICNVFARWLRLSDEEIKLATLSGLLHDIGKTILPEEIVKKPNKLTDTEYNIIKTHTKEGYKILQNQPISDHIKQAALLHHERCDGTGYPFGLHDAQIDSYAKLVCIADVYDAMTSARIYRGPLCPFTVIGIFENEGLHKYDTHFIMTFLENVVSTYLQNRVRLSNGMEGEIVYINKHRLSAPTVKCGDQFIDLSAKRDITIESLI